MPKFGANYCLLPQASGRGREPRPGIQCPDWCGPVHVTGVRKEDITCPCGYGYYSKRTGEFISGDLVRAGKAPPKDAEEITVPERCWSDPTRGGRDGQIHEFPDHNPRGFEPPERPRNSSPDLGHVRGGRHVPTSDVPFWLPEADIDFDVISADLPVYLGPYASVVRHEHPRVGTASSRKVCSNLDAKVVQDRRRGYLVRGVSALTVVCTAL